MRGKAHSDEVKAQVMAALLAGQGVGEIATEFNLDESTVRNWKRRIPEDQLTRLNEKKEADFGGLVASYLQETLTTLEVQVRHFRDKDWLKEQPANELAVLHGVCADKAFRLLEAAERATTSGNDEGEPTAAQ